MPDNDLAKPIAPDAPPNGTGQPNTDVVIVPPKPVPAITTDNPPKLVPPQAKHEAFELPCPVGVMVHYYNHVLADQMQHMNGAGPYAAMVVGKTDSGAILKVFPPHGPVHQVADILPYREGSETPRPSRYFMPIAS